MVFATAITEFSKLSAWWTSDPFPRGTEHPPRSTPCSRSVEETGNVKSPSFPLEVASSCLSTTIEWYYYRRFELLSQQKVFCSHEGKVKIAHISKVTSKCFPRHEPCTGILREINMSIHVLRITLQRGMGVVEVRCPVHREIDEQHAYHESLTPDAVRSYRKFYSYAPFELWLKNHTPTTTTSRLSR
jgi:hypothetical protein